MVGGRVLHPTINSGNSKGFMFTGQELALVHMLVLGKVRLKEEKRPTD